MRRGPIRSEGDEVNVTLFSCGPAANESELKSFEFLKSRLVAEARGDEWVLLTNLAFSVTHQLQADEIDIVSIGPTGVRVVEIKHWSPQWIEEHKREVEDAADLVASKARKIGTTLRRSVKNLDFVAGVILLTQEPSKVKRYSGQTIRGVTIYTLSDWKAALDFDATPTWSAQQVQLMATVLQPRSTVAIDGSLRRLAGYVNLELQTARDERFHRVYKGSHPARRDQVVLHLYDLSCSDDKNAADKAKREFETLHRLQLHSWSPRLLDSFQDAPGYAGEMYFFTLVDPAAPSIEERSSDTTWTTDSRLDFVRKVVLALSELHGADHVDEPIVHRNLTPHTILVKHDNTPILTGFERARLPSAVSVASTNLPQNVDVNTLAPEVRAGGLSAADQRSDVFALCASLSRLFRDRNDDVGVRVLGELQHGQSAEPSKRSTLQHLSATLSALAGEIVSAPPPPPARFWTEDQVIVFHNHHYRIVSRLGSGGVGITFKVIEVDRTTKEDQGTYVAKVVPEREMAPRVLHAYSRAKPHLRHTSLSQIHEVASEWQENSFAALMTWISGTPLVDYAGVFALLAEDQQESSSEALALRWLRTVCEALDVLHRNGLIHGDVSPRNLIVEGSSLVLTDYDFVQKSGEQMVASGTVMYSSQDHLDRRPATPSDDFFALAASLFHVVFDREPFRFAGDLDKTHGLNWEGLPRADYPTLAALLDIATHPDPTRRFADSASVLLALTPALPTRDGVAGLPKGDSLDAGNAVATLGTAESHSERSQNTVEWLLPALQSYPGSRWGNRETRGLDTDFAAKTYVETALEQALTQDVQERRVRLVILCGNAGDGKTALLQHLAYGLGLGEHPSSERILSREIPGGPVVRMNLDGSAAWQGRSADNILDEFLAPFQDGPPNEDIVHLLAINDGRLLEWLDGVEKRTGSTTHLTGLLNSMLQQETTQQTAYVRFINLNQRSLVGGVIAGQRTIDTGFLDRLTDQLYGGADAAAIWSPCRTCSAQERCEVYKTACVLGPDTLPSTTPSTVRQRARKRLFESLQAVHLLGETHITMRELRAALVYILFGLDHCENYHAENTSQVLSYWDRAFVADSPARQGDVLAELARFDPALEAHPQIDRYLQSEPIADSGKTAPHYPSLTLASARRRTYFEWTRDDLDQVARNSDALDSDALDLARGRHLRTFRNLPLSDETTLRRVCGDLCRGISRLEDLPTQALERPGVVPLRITPRTPTETAFWVEKPLDAFRLEADLPREEERIERLHRQATLIYTYRTGHNEERLRLGAELFHLLMELADGYQLGDVSTDDTFAHLSIFVQRLVREDERTLLAWNPMQDDRIYRVASELRTAKGAVEQRLVITPLGES